MPLTPAIWCARVKWCSNGVCISQTFCSHEGESSSAAIERIGEAIKAALTEDMPSADCSPPCF